MTKNTQLEIAAMHRRRAREEERLRRVDVAARQVAAEMDDLLKRPSHPDDDPCLMSALIAWRDALQAADRGLELKEKARRLCAVMGVL